MMISRFGFSLILLGALLAYPLDALAFGSKSKESKESSYVYSSDYVKGGVYDENDPRYNEYYDRARAPASAQGNSGGQWEFDEVQVEQKDFYHPPSGRRPPSYSQKYEVWERSRSEVSNDPNMRLYNQQRNYGENHQYTGKSYPRYGAGSEQNSYPVDPRQDISNSHLARPPYPYGYERAPASASAVSNYVNDVSADKALASLKSGNQRFVQGRQKSRTSGLSKKDRIRLLAGESPHAVIITSSDSRVSPELLFDQRLGEVFVIRVMGPALDKAVIGSIEYAVQKLGVQLVLVLGSENSAGVKSALMNPIGASLGSPYVGHLLRDIHPRVSNYYRRPASSGFSREGAANARGIVKDLIQKSTILRSRVGAGAVQVHSAMYYLDSGMVDFH